MGHPAAYVFTDIEGSTRRWEKTPARMRTAVARHDELIDELIEKHSGTIQHRAGDGVFATFRFGNPLTCALDIQLALQREDWSAVGGMAVRIGIHAVPSATDAVDDAVANRAARIMASGWGGQIVVSEQAADTYALPAGSELTDLGIHHLRDVDEPLHLFALVHPGMQRTVFPPLHSLATRESLPATTSPFFGRERELEEVLALLEQPMSRLVTVVGPGGNGKSRFTVEVATRLSEREAVHYVPLETVSREFELVTALASALRFPLYGSTSREAQLIDYLRNRRALIVFDGAEGIAGDAGFIDALLSSCPQLSILVTSREPLHLAGESLYRLAGMPVPSGTNGGLTGSAAYKLFVHEARAITSGFEIAEDELDTFRELCELLRGSPLGLHLAARSTRLASLQSLVEDLRAGIGFSRSTGSNAADRRARLSGVFEYSWTALTPALQGVLARVSVFSGGFDQDAAGQVARADLSMLAVLEQKSLLEVDGHHRFDLHPMIRSLAREKLESDREKMAAAQSAHCSYYLDLMSRAFSIRPQPNQGKALDRMQGEIANLRAAWLFAVHNGLAGKIRQATEPLFYFLIMRALYDEGGQLFKVDTSAWDDDDGTLGRYLSSVLANCLLHGGDFEGALAAANRAIAGDGGDAMTRGHAHQALGNLAHTRGDFEAARRHYEQAIEIRGALGDLMGSYYSVTSLAALHLLVGDYEAARAGVKESYRVCTRLGNTTGMMAAYVLAGDIARREDRIDDARANYDESLEIEGTLHNPQLKATILIKLGSVLAQLGDTAGALEHLRKSLDLAGEVGDERLRLTALVEIGAGMRAAGDSAGARSPLLEGIELGFRLGAKPLLLRALLELGRVELGDGNDAAARRIAGALAATDLGVRQAGYQELIAGLGEPMPSDGDDALEEVVTEILSERGLSSLRL